MKTLSVFTIISLLGFSLLLYFVGGSSSLVVVPPREIKELVEAAESNLKGLGENNVLEAAESLVAKSDFSKRTRRRRYTNCKLQVASSLQVKSVACIVGLMPFLMFIVLRTQTPTCSG
jgi:hypothetical protein